jgi:hypothetical protein
MRAHICLLLLTPGIGAWATAALADTVILTVGASDEYRTISAAVSAADADNDPSNYYDIRVTPGTYINDFPYVTRPMTIEVDPLHAGKRVTLKATENLPNEKGIILTTASLTVNGLNFTGAKIIDALGGNGAGIRDQNSGPAASLVVQNSTFTGNQEGILTGQQWQPELKLFPARPLRELRL